MLHSTNKLVSSGLGVGLRMVLLTRRPQKLHNDSLTQVGTLAVHPADVMISAREPPTCILRLTLNKRLGELVLRNVPISR
jgi:hypothetical protein